MPSPNEEHPVLEVVAPAGGPPTDGAKPPVTDPPLLIRIGTMMQSLREEARECDLDEGGRRRLTELHRRAVETIKEALSDELRAELDEFALPLGDTPSAGELQVAQAQLVGWLDGLFRGIQAAVFNQQVSAQRQLQELRGGGRSVGPDQGQYL